MASESIRGWKNPIIFVLILAAMLAGWLLTAQAQQGFCGFNGVGDYLCDKGGTVAASALAPTSKICIFMPSGDSSVSGDSHVVSSTTELQAALNKAKPGDAILLEAGLYTVEKNTLNGLGSGTASQPIMLRPAPGAEGRVEWTPSKRHTESVVVDGVSNIVIEGLKIHGYRRPVQILNSNSVVFRGNDLYDFYRACLAVREASTNILIEGNKIHVCGVGSGRKTKSASGVNGEGIYIGHGHPEEEPKNRLIRHIIIRHNEVYHTTDEGMNIKLFSDVLVENNYVHDIETSDPGGINFKVGGQRGNKGTNLIARGNVVQDIRGHPDKPESGIGINGGDSAVITGNTICNSQAQNIEAAGSEVGNTTTSSSAVCNAPAQQLKSQMQNLPAGSGTWRCIAIKQVGLIPTLTLLANSQYCPTLYDILG